MKPILKLEHYETFFQKFKFCFNSESSFEMHQPIGNVLDGDSQTMSRNRPIVFEELKRSCILHLMPEIPFQCQKIYK